MSPRLAFAAQTVFEAGRSTLAHFRQGIGFEHKEDGTPVTIADQEAEKLIRGLISAKYPSEEILGEEEGGNEGSHDRWVVDPIDGTKSFACGVPLYATLLSFERDRQPVLGVCYFPALDEMLMAEVGFGTTLNGRRIRVSQTPLGARATVCTAGHKGMGNAGLAEALQAFAPRVQATRTWCDAYGHALVASGRVEAMIDPVVSRWDISALIPIVEEAGGRLTDLAGRDNPFTQAISSNGLVHAELLEQLR